MNAMLLLLAIALLLVAGAVTLWWNSHRRQQQQASTQYLQRQLEARNQAPAGADIDARSGAQTTATAQRLDHLLVRAGLAPGPKVPLILAAGFVVLVLLASLRMHSVLGGAIMAIVYVALATFWFGYRIQKQHQKLVGQLPELLENMVRLTSIGQSLPMAFQSAAANAEVPLKRVLDGTLRGMKAGMDLDDALHQSARGYRIKELKLLESIIRMSNQYGGRTDQVLQRMSDFMRDLEQAQQELKSITSETRMASWVLGLLPLLAGGALMLLNPAFFKPMFTHHLGHQLLLIALALEALGAFLLYRLAKSL